MAHSGLRRGPGGNLPLPHPFDGPAQFDPIETGLPSKRENPSCKEKA